LKKTTIKQISKPFNSMIIRAEISGYKIIWRKRRQLLKMI